MQLPADNELCVARVGECAFPSPYPGGAHRFVDDVDGVLLSADIRDLEPFLRDSRRPPAFELAGPRRRIFVPADQVTAGIVTCGGLCPGLNNVIRSLVLTLTHGYGVRKILGFRYGYEGLSSHGMPPLALTPDLVADIHGQGGTLLGTSRGPQDVGDMVTNLARLSVGMLFAIGGDGTLRGASALSQELARRNLPIPVVAIPKTIDNDIEWVERSFGFATAVEEARIALGAAHAEARGALNGIGLVKLMGRESGFIAAHASLASSDVNFCLVPEVPLALEGEEGFFLALERRLAQRHHVVIVVAEGAAQDLLQDQNGLEHDASGNLRLKDVGTFLREAIARHFASASVPVTIKYIDPSYIIRSLPAGSLDSELCLVLGQHAVHAAMAGRTEVVIGYVNQRFVHVPIPLAVRRRKRLNPFGETWQRVLEATGQPRWEADQTPGGEPIQRAGAGQSAVADPASEASAAGSVGKSLPASK